MQIRAVTKKGDAGQPALRHPEAPMNLSCLQTGYRIMALE